MACFSAKRSLLQITVFIQCLDAHRHRNNTRTMAASTVDDGTLTVWDWSPLLMETPDDVAVVKFPLFPVATLRATGRQMGEG